MFDRSCFFFAPPPPALTVDAEEEEEEEDGAKAKAKQAQAGEDVALLVNQLLEYALYSALVVSAQLLDVLRTRPFPFEPQSTESVVLAQLKPLFKCLADASGGDAESPWYDRPFGLSTCGPVGRGSVYRT